MVVFQHIQEYRRETKMKQWEILQKMLRSQLTVVLRASSKEELIQLGSAVYEGGGRSLEVTYTSPGAGEAITELKNLFPNAVVGAGSVLDSETVRHSQLHGAEYIVAPSFDAESAKTAFRYQTPYIPGCMSLSEMTVALEHGCSLIKLFPGQHFTPDFIKAVKGPLPQVSIMPTGGVSIDNAAKWIERGAVCVGVGGEITNVFRDHGAQEVTKQTENFLRTIGGASK
jgi:2-dehydro-3-deoxyphosphogluconate aldolase / (4S)-4-hydroxy-2-oxoglutarate aldolase